MLKYIVQTACRSNYPSAPGTRKFRSQVRRNWSDRGSNFAGIGQAWPTLGLDRSNVVDAGPKLAELGHIWRSESVSSWPTSTNVGVMWSRTAPKGSSIPRHWSVLGKAGRFGTHAGQHRTKLGRHRPSMARTWVKLGRMRPELPNVAPNSSGTGSNSVDPGKHRPASGLDAAPDAAPKRT